MNFTQYIFIGALLLLFFNQKTRLASSVILASYAVYIPFVLELDGDQYYYHLSALIDLLIGLAVYKKFKIVGLLSFLLIPVHSLGLALYDGYYEPALYDNMCVLIIILQLIALLYKATPDGIITWIRRRFMVCITYCYSDKSYY